MASKLENEYCWCAYKLNSMVNSVRVDNMTSELTIIVANEENIYIS